MDLFKPYSGSAGVGDSSADWQRAGQSSRLRRLGIAAWLLLLPGLASATPPIANPDAFGVAEGQSFSDNVLKNDSNPPPDTTLEARLNTGPTQHNGVFSLNPDGSFDYQHDGSENAQDSFTYTAVDPVTAESSGPVQVTISISPVNDTPVITGQDSLSTPEDTGLTISTADLDITDGDSSSFTLGIQPGPNYSISGNTINPSLNYAGPLTVPVTVSDGNSVSDPFALSVTVSPVNDQPVIQGQDTLSTLENSQLSISADDLDIVDPDSSSFTVILQGGANYSISGTTITPDTDFNGTLIVPTAVNDGSSAGNAVSEPFNLVVTVTSVNERPVITGQNPLSTPEEAELTLSVGDLTIVDGDSNSFTLDVGNGNNYSVSGNRITPDKTSTGFSPSP
jgi:VCBS repeat-containing protein